MRWKGYGDDGLASLFWYLIKDFDTKTYDVVGPINNDDAYNELIVVASKSSGHRINTSAPPYDSTTKDDLCVEAEKEGLVRDRELMRKVKGRVKQNTVYEQRGMKS